MGSLRRPAISDRALVPRDKYMPSPGAEVTASNRITWGEPRGEKGGGGGGVPPPPPPPLSPYVKRGAYLLNIRRNPLQELQDLVVVDGVRTAQLLGEFVHACGGDHGNNAVRLTTR